MEDNRKEKVDFPKSLSQQSIFPISSCSSVSVEDHEKPALLFPCVGEVETGKIQETQLSWLKNESYKPENFPRKGKYDPSTAVSSEDEDIIEKITEIEGEEIDITERNNERVYHHRKRSKKKYKKQYYSHSECSSSDESNKKSNPKKKHKKRKRRKRTKSDLDSDEQEKVHKPDTIWIEDSGLSTEEAYRIHCKPDVGNLVYGSLYKLDLATFKIRKSIQCLGLNRKYIPNLEKKKKNKNTSIESRYWRNTEILSEVPEFVKACRKSSNLFVGNIENYSYLPLDLPSKKEEKEINRKEMENEDSIESKESLTTQRTAELNKILRENPHDINTWIELVKFQSETVSIGDLTRSGYTYAVNDRKKKHSKVITEKQISVLEKALEENPSSIELILYHLELCNGLWEDSRILERWKKVVFAYPNKILLWRKYLSFIQSRFSTFTFRKAQKVYEKCFNTLLSIKEGSFVSHQAEEGIEEDMLDLLVQYCKFMRQSGHTEKAIACLQAMVELNLLCPGELNDSTPTSGQLAFLETFWDSGQPRFGESGAVGWNMWMNKSGGHKKPLGLESIDLTKIFKALNPAKTKDSEIPTTTEREEEMVKGVPKWKAWLKVEVSRDNTQLKPWRPEKGETDDDCEDPERLVLFDDISSFLFKLINMNNKLKLVLHFLEMLGVPIDPSSSTQNLETQRYFELSIQTDEQLIKEQQLFNLGTGWQRCDFWQKCEYASSNIDIKPTKERLHIVRNIFMQSLSLFKEEYRDYLMTTWLMYEFHLSQVQESEKSRGQSFKEVYKLAKSLLKDVSNRNNLTLWQVFAGILIMSGDVIEGRRVFDSALSMGSQLVNKEDKESLASLYRAYAELELKKTVRPIFSSGERSTLLNHNRALHLLVSFMEDNKYEPINDESVSVGISPARILKAKRKFTELCENSIQRINGCSSSKSCNGSEVGDKIFPPINPSVDAIVCTALFTYVSSGIQAASSIYDKVLSSLSSKNDALNLKREHIWTSYVNLLNFHSQRIIIPLKAIRSVLHRALQEFPDNPFFLHCFLKVESKSNLTGQVRRFFDHITHSAKSPVSWIYAIHYENMRSEALVMTMNCTEYFRVSLDQPSSVVVTSLPATGISHRQRALFDKATSSRPGRQCIALWKMYMEFELQQGNKQQAKAIFYQALQHCPWAKTLYLHAVEAFPDDLQSNVDLMDEKELRVRTPVEEIDILLEDE